MRQKAFLILFLAIFLSFSGANYSGGGGGDQVNFPDIYLDESVAPGGVGSLADPYSDFSEINWTTGGDNSIFDYYAGAEAASVTINLKEGEEWREQMTIGCSGSATYPIVITSYGSGADPIINGSDVVTTWASTADSTVYNACDEKTTAERWYRTILTTLNQPSSNATQVRIQLQAFAGNAYTLKGVAIGERSGATEDYGDTPSRITFDTGSSSVTVSAGGTKWSDWVDYDFDASTAHLIHLQTDGSDTVGKVEGYLDGAYYKTTAADETLTVDVTADDTTGHFMGLKIIEVKIGTNTYSASVTTEPLCVWMDGTNLTEGSDKDTLNDHEWFWEANLLYLRDDTGDPDEDGVTIEAAIRDDVIYTNTKSYITFDNLVAKNSNDRAFFIRYGSNIEIISCTAQETPSEGMLMYGTDKFLIDSCTLSYNGRNAGGMMGENGISVETKDGYNITDSEIIDCDISYTQGTTGQGITISRGQPEYTADAINCRRNVVYYCRDDGIKYYGGDNCIVEDNYIHHTGTSGGAGNNGLSFYKTMSNLIVRRNRVYSTTAGGIVVNGSDGDVVGSIYYNLCTDNATEDAGAEIKIYQNAGVINIYNNVGYAGNGYGFEIDASSNVTLKNNVFFGNTSYDLYVHNAVASLTFDNNCYYRASGDIISYGGDTYTVATFGDYQTEKTQDANSLTSDPLFIDVANDIFKINPHSPCIDKGTDVSLTVDYLGRRIRHTPDIGAYENQTNVLFLSAFPNPLLLVLMAVFALIAYRRRC